MNRYAYVANNPAVWVDAEGLASIGGELYAGIGGGLTLGWDSCTGPFMKFKAGFGIGAGASFDPGELSPGRGAGIGGHGSSYGLYASGQAQALVLGWSGGARIGNAYDARGNWRPTGPEFEKPRWLPSVNWPPTKPKKLGLSVSVGAEGALF